MNAHNKPAAVRQLRALLAPWLEVPPERDRVINQISLDSRELGAGGLFAAVAGSRTHGLDYVEQAVARGAAAVLWEPAQVDAERARALCAERDVPLLALEGLGQQLSAIAARFYGAPSRSLRVLGVTGTDGKTSVSQFLAQALSEPQAPCGVIGTLGYGLLGTLVESGHTTPDAVSVQRLLADMRDLGAGYAAMEVSSHALVQGRVADVHFDTAILTNLTRDHLDYHGSAEAYAEAKATLFRMPGLARAVLNRDDEFGRRMERELPEGVARWTYSLRPRERADVVCIRLECLPEGLRMEFVTPKGGAGLSLPLMGRFNAANVAAVLSTLLALGLELDEAMVRLGRLTPVAGRMERFGGGEAPVVAVDYAHTPGALAAALDAVRAHCNGRVWVVFGCGGDRDRGKRAEMGCIADQKADELVLTSDNPRSENPQAILDQILEGVIGHEPFVVADRREAITLAVTHAGPADVVLVAGKGHESYQLVGSERLPFDDRLVVQQALKERF